MDWFTFVHAACDIPFRLATRSEKLVGKAAGVLAATFFQMYLFPVFKHLTATPFTVEVAFGCLQVAPIFVAACALVGTTRVANDNVRQAKLEICLRFICLV
jgi:predicted lysophospholipase L1 biosynthesis ABC-type transport system permease subunit